jgi:2-C-methyl-D-erythritol 4-phosphate cytidylyltransferase
MVTVSFRLQCIKQIVIVVGDEYMEYMKNLLTKYRFTKVDLVKGSTTRHRSIYNGVKALETGKNRHRSIYNGVKALETGKNRHIK